MNKLANEVAFVVALRTINAPCWVTYHAEFHARPSTDCKLPFRCSTCKMIDAIITVNFEWVGGDDGHWALIKKVKEKP